MEEAKKCVKVTIFVVVLRHLQIGKWRFRLIHETRKLYFMCNLNTEKHMKVQRRQVERTERMVRGFKVEHERAWPGKYVVPDASECWTVFKSLGRMTLGGFGSGGSWEVVAWSTVSEEDALAKAHV